MTIHEHPTHCWIGRKTCGCVMSIAGDDMNRKELAKFVSQMIKDGLIPERITWEDCKGRVISEPTFFNCPHLPEPTTPEQPTLLTGL